MRKYRIAQSPPTDWNKKRIDEVCEISVGRDLKAECFSDENDKEYVYPVYSNSVENRGLYGYYNFPEFTGIGLTVVGRGAGLGTAFSRNGSFGAIGRLLVLFPYKEISAHYLTDYINHKISFYVESSGIPQLTGEQIGKYTIQFPPLPEQNAIASLLSTWDLAIEKTERLIAAKERRYLWFSQKQLFGDAADTVNVSKKTKWFSVPDHWKIVNIGKIASEVSTFNRSGESIPVLSCTKYDGLVDSLTYFDKQIFSHDTSTYKVVTKGQFAYATNHIEEGSIGYQDVYDKGLVSPMYTVFETNEKVDDSYLYKVFKSVVYLHIFRANTSSSVDRRGSLRWKEFAKLPIPLPPLEEQKQIAAILTTARQEIDLLKKQADAYRRQKRGLMQRLLTGEWRVRVG